MYSVGSSVIATVGQQKDLGIIVTNDLSWSCHYSKICKNAYSSLRLHLIKRVLPATSSVLLKNLKTLKIEFGFVIFVFYFLQSNWLIQSIWFRSGCCRESCLGIRQPLDHKEDRRFVQHAFVTMRKIYITCWSCLNTFPRVFLQWQWVFDTLGKIIYS